MAHAVKPSNHVTNQSTLHSSCQTVTLESNLHAAGQANSTNAEDRSSERNQLRDLTFKDTYMHIANYTDDNVLSTAPRGDVIVKRLSVVFETLTFTAIAFFPRIRSCHLYETGKPREREHVHNPQ